MTPWTMLVCLRIVAAGLGGGCDGSGESIKAAESTDFQYEALVPDPTGGWYAQQATAEVLRCKNAACTNFLRDFVAKIQKDFGYTVPVIEMPRHNAFIVFAPRIERPDGGPPVICVAEPRERDFARMTMLASLWDRSELR